MSALPAPGSMAAHDALLSAYIAWRGEDGAFDAEPTTARAAAADLAWLRVLAHAQNCGCAMTEPHVLKWVRRRLCRYAEVMGREVPA